MPRCQQQQGAKMDQEDPHPLQCVSEKEICTLLGISRLTAQRWREAKENPLPAHKVNRRVLYSLSEVHAWN
jgi:excisionase family DNA binding protein